MVLTTTGHIALAKSVMDQTLFLAWGELPSFIYAPVSITANEGAASSGSLVAGDYNYYITSTTPLGESLVSSVTPITVLNSNSSVVLSWGAVTGASGYNIYGRVAGNIFKIGSTTNTNFVDDGSVTSGSAIPSSNTTSATPWTTSPDLPNINHTQLYGEVGRRKILVKKYVLPDENGPYVTTQGRWSESATPTKHVYLYAGFDLADAQDKIIYQFGLFMDTIPATGYENHNYLLPGQISDIGRILSLENVSPIYRNASTREVHEIVMTF